MKTLKTYRARFYGRKLGAIGISDQYFAVVSGLTEEDAQLKLYDRFEHITGLRMELSSVGDAGDYPEYKSTQQNSTKGYTNESN